VKYVLLFVETEHFTSDMAAMSPSERQRAYDRVNEWFAAHADKLRGGSKLKAPETATERRSDNDDRQCPAAPRARDSCSREFGVCAGRVASERIRQCRVGQCRVGRGDANLVSKVVARSYAVTDDDDAAVGDAGLSEDQIFEIMVCAAIGAADRQYASGLTALTEAIGGRQ
jgi:hypothetical protein